MTIGDKIKKVRELKNITQEAVAKQLGISVTAYGDYERNKADISWSRLEQIAEVFEVAIKDIVNLPDTFNIQQMTNSQAVVGNGTQYNYDQSLVEGYKIAIEQKEREVQWLRQQLAEAQAERKAWQERAGATK
jgi:transcriptional regulator with XRE-family HTH domain